MLPGKDTLQPLATLTGLVRSVASARAEVLSPGGAEGSSRRRRGGRGGRGSSESSDDLTSSAELTPSTYDPGRAADGLVLATEATSRRQEPELVAVPMEADQELVFGWMGLNPALLLDQPSQPLENLMVRVIRPGEDAEAVLDEARQQLAAAGGRRRRRGRGGAGTEPAASALPVPTGAAPVEITPLPEPTVFAPGQEPLSMVVGMARQEPEVSAVSVPATQPPLPDGAVAAAAAPEPQQEEESGEPRRRRRRSSASN